MAVSSEPQIVSVDRFTDGLMITFSDGQFALYPAALLYGCLSQAIMLPEPESETFTDGVAEESPAR